MSQRDGRRGSLAPGAKGRTALSVPPTRPDSFPQKPAKNALECLRHDARSAAHALSGFAELLAVEALGPMTDAQQRSILHVQASAQRLFELIETSLELAQGKQPFSLPGLRPTSLFQLTRRVVEELAHKRPDLVLSFPPSALEAELPVQVETDAFRRVVHVLVEVIASQGCRAAQIRFSQTDLHASVVLSGECNEPDLSSKLRQSSSAPTAASADLEAMADAWTNRDYIRLKRCQALLARQQGGLLVTPDLTRIRIMLPVQRGR